MIVNENEFEAVDGIIKEAENRINNLLKCRVKLNMTTMPTKDKSPELLRAAISEVMQVTWEEVQGDKKTLELVTARQLYCFFCQLWFKHLSQAKVADDLKYQEHTSVITGSRKVKDLIEIGDEYMTTKLNMVSEKFL